MDPFGQMMYFYWAEAAVLMVEQTAQLANDPAHVPAGQRQAAAQPSGEERRVGAGPNRRRGWSMPRWLGPMVRREAVGPRRASVPPQR